MAQSCGDARDKQASGRTQEGARGGGAVLGGCAAGAAWASADRPVGAGRPPSVPNNTPVQTAPASPTKGAVGGGAAADPVAADAVAADGGGSDHDGRGERPGSPTTTNMGAGVPAGGQAGVKGRRESAGGAGAGGAGAGHVDENSPISIINRRQIFSTSDSRSSAASQVAGPPGDESGTSDDGGIAPHSFYFDKDRSVTDPHVKLDEERDNMSSWIKTRQGADVYSLSESSVKGKSAGDDDDESAKKTGEFSIHDGLISPQAPRSALSMGSSCGRVMSRDSPSGGLAVSRKQRSRSAGDDENYVPPPPPKFINSKLDGVRSRLLVNPRIATPKIDEDLGTATAAAVLSNMRSSPFHFAERPQQFSSRPGSSSFSKSYPRPIIRIHHREHSAADDEHAILDGDDDDDYDLDDESKKENSSADKLRTNDVNGEKTDRGVTWNKNGKRINRRMAATESKKKKSNKAQARTKNKVFNEDDSVNDDGDENYALYHDEDEDEDDEGSAKSSSKSSRQKNAMGSRSRTGCWICRLRKKKCTEERPSCFNCERLNLECYYGVIKPDFVSDPKKKLAKLEEIKTKTKEAKRNAMRKKPSRSNS